MVVVAAATEVDENESPCDEEQDQSDSQIQSNPTYNNDTFNNIIELVSAIYLLIYRQFERKNYKFPIYFQSVDFDKFHEKSISKFQHIDPINNVKFKQTLASSNIPVLKNPLYFTFPVSLLNSLMKLLLFIRFRLDSNYNTHILDEFFSLTRDMHDFTCVSIAKTTIKFDKLLNEITGTKFDLKTQVSDNSPYVDTIVNQIQSFNNYLSTTFLSELNVDNNDVNDIWRYITLFITNTIVEGYTTITKCTQAGRDLMQLDYQQLTISLDSIFPFKKMTTRGYVEDAIRCFYFPEDAFEEFINDPLTQSRYTPNQLKSLTKLTHGKSSKFKQKLGKIFN